MPYKIALCDDDPAALSLMQKLVSEWAQSRGGEAHISAYTSAEAFLIISGDADSDILLLDVEMHDIDGITLARRLRATGCEAQIVFVTGYPDYMAEGYDVAALHYLLKPVQVDKLFAVLDRAARNLSRVRDSALFETADGPARLYLDDIIFVEAFLHATELTTVSAVYRLTEPISKLEAQLGSGFVRCHRSYLANLRWIARLTRDSVVLDNGKRLPLSRRLAAGVSRRFISHYRGEQNEP